MQHSASLYTVSKYLTILAILLAHLLSPYSVFADLINLKGANGQVARFNIQSVQDDGIMAQNEGAYTFNLIQWEHLDLEWLQENQSEIWQDKLEFDAKRKIAYKDFKFGQTRIEVHSLMNAMKAKSVPSSCFNETDPRATWVLFDPKTARRFGRLIYVNERLVEIEIHINFNEYQSMKSEWENLQKLAAEYLLKPEESNYFPRASDWERWKSKTAQKEQKLLMTHRWSDETRTAELGLQFQKFDLGPAVSTTHRLTVFGASANTTVSRSTDSNWVVYKTQQTSH